MNALTIDRADYKTFEELLTPEELETLSWSAKLLYANLWNRMNNFKKQTISIRDIKVSELARASLHRLPVIHDELSHAGLMLIRSCPHPEIEGEDRTRYTFPTTDNVQPHIDIGPTA